MELIDLYFLGGASVEGYRLKQLVAQWCCIFIDFQSGEKPDCHKIDFLLSEMSAKYKKGYERQKEMNFRNEEIPILKSWGFEAPKSTPENLMEDLCSSIAIMSTTSSVLSTALAFGRIVVRVKETKMEYVREDTRLILPL